MVWEGVDIGRASWQVRPENFLSLFSSQRSRRLEGWVRWGGPGASRDSAPGGCLSPRLLHARSSAVLQEPFHRQSSKMLRKAFFFFFPPPTAGFLVILLLPPCIS